MARLWLLGAPSLSMEHVEQVLERAGESFRHMRDARGKRVTTRNAFMGAAVELDEDTDQVLYVECQPDQREPNVRWRLIVSIPDARPDRCFGQTVLGQVISELARTNSLPESFVRASTVGELRALPLRGDYVMFGRHVFVVSGDPHDLHARQVNRQFLYAAASDYCLRDAYAGACVEWGVDPDGLLDWRLYRCGRGLRLRHALYLPEAIRLVHYWFGAIPEVLAGSGIRKLPGPTVSSIYQPFGLSDEAFTHLVREVSMRYGVALAAVDKRTARLWNASREQAKAFVAWATARGLEAVEQELPMRARTGEVSE